MTRKKSDIVAIVTMCFVFAMISFVTNMAAPFGNIWKYHYSWAGMMGNMMNFLAYLAMGIPAGKLLSRIGYKKTLLVALAVGFTGILVQWLSSKFGAGVNVFAVQDSFVELNFIIYLLGAFVCGVSVCLLNTVVNPMLNILGGGGNEGNRLIQTGAFANSLVGASTPLLVGALIGQVTDKTSMMDVNPLLYIAMGVYFAAFVIISLIKLEEPASSSSDDSVSPWRSKRFVLGVIAIFFYVGIEVGIPAQLNFYLTDLPTGGAAVGGAIAAVYWLMMMVGRLVGSAISGKVSSKTQLTFTSSCAILFILLAIILPKDIVFAVPGYSVADGFSMFNIPLSASLLFVCGLFTSVMWGNIFNLAFEGFEGSTEKASGIFMMMVCGGGIMPLIQDSIAKSTSVFTSYYLVIAMLAFLLYFALSAKKATK